MRLISKIVFLLDCASFLGKFASEKNDSWFHALLFYDSRIFKPQTSFKFWSSKLPDISNDCNQSFLSISNATRSSSFQNSNFSSNFQEQLYTSFTLVFMFIIPLLILVSSYISTFRTISSKWIIFYGCNPATNPKALIQIFPNKVPSVCSSSKRRFNRITCVEATQIDRNSSTRRKWSRFGSRLW